MRERSERGREGSKEGEDEQKGTERNRQEAKSWSQREGVTTDDRKREREEERVGGDGG